MLLGWNAAPAATQIVPRFELTDPLNVSEAKSTTWVLSKLRSLGIPLASGYTAVGLWQSEAKSATAGSDPGRDQHAERQRRCRYQCEDPRAHD